MNAIRGTLYLSACRQTVSLCASTPSRALNTTTAPTNDVVFPKGAGPAGMGSASQDVIVRRKGRVLGVWANRASREFESVPSYYVMHLSEGFGAGMKADITVFDPARVRDMATFEKPHQYAEGISSVIVNGQVVVADGLLTGALPGRVLRR